MLNRARRALAQPVSDLAGKILARTPLTPNVLTLAGFIFAVATAWVLGTGHFFLGGFLVLLSGAFDILDGALARATGHVTKFGGLFDSTLDRFSEAAIFFGLLAFYVDAGSFEESLLVCAALIGSMMTSYVRARAEGLGLKCEVGIFTRPERVILLAIGLIANQMLVILWIMAVLSNAIAVQRVVHVWQQTKGTK